MEENLIKEMDTENKQTLPIRAGAITELTLLTAYMWQAITVRWSEAQLWKGSEHS